MDERTKDVAPSRGGMDRTSISSLLRAVGPFNNLILHRFQAEGGDRRGVIPGVVPFPNLTLYRSIKHLKDLKESRRISYTD